MRLIDADYLIEDRVSNDPVVIAAKCAPDVDAIPVEWLRNVLEEAKEFPRSEHETIVAIPYLIKRWQKEQEGV